MYEGDMMMTKSKDSRSFLTRMAQIGLGLLMIAGAVWAITQPATALNTLMVILGLMLLLRGTAGIVPYYRLKDKPILKDKAGLALGVDVINDVAALEDDGAIAAVAASSAAVHLRLYPSGCQFHAASRLHWLPRSSQRRT